MEQSQFQARQVRAKTNEVVDYHKDDTKPGKPLYLLIPGGLIALASLALIISIAYRTWWLEDFAPDSAINLMLLLAPFYIGGVFLFSYGYELYNIPRALRLTAIIVFITLAAVVIVAVLFALAGGLSSGSKSSSSKSRARSSSASASQTSSTSHSPGFGYGGSAIFLGGGGTRVETREVTREVVKEVPKEPMPITCPFCGTSYIPAEHNYICPNCGAPTPKELIEQSQMPKIDQAQT
ncbi:MAG: hypothetical protein HYR70_12100 [Chloroflexi bacterium]|nr:hypothetical protein [Chloroflexota bacterium]MBI3339372.1 hypothetical protein [Chloroflexota bacterium]